MKKTIITMVMSVISLTMPILSLGQTESEGKTSSLEETTISEPKKYIGQNGYIDLGLPSGTLWAYCNLGSTTPNQPGLYFAWGETSKYRGSESKVDDMNMGDISGQPEYDAATHEWGKLWQIPTHKQWQELIDKCKWHFVTFSGTKGYKVVGPNGNSIFLMLPGTHDGRKVSKIQEIGNYWSSTPYTNEGAFIMFCDDWRHTILWGKRSNGYSIRPVIKK